MAPIAALAGPGEVLRLCRTSLPPPDRAFSLLQHSATCTPRHMHVHTCTRVRVCTHTHISLLLPPLWHINLSENEDSLTLPPQLSTY